MGSTGRRATRVLPAILLLLIAILPMRIGLVWESTAQLANAEEAKPAAVAEDSAAPPAAEPQASAASDAAGAAAPEATASEAVAQTSAEPFDTTELTKADFEVVQQEVKHWNTMSQRRWNMGY